MRTFKLTLAYDGTAYAGWQRQADRPTIQGLLEEALAKIVGQATPVIGSGRTDAGVHAMCQVASFDADVRLEPDVLLRAINAHLPDDVAAWDLVAAPTGFHARRDAKRKRYRYLIQRGTIRDVFARRYAWHVPVALDVAAISAAAATWQGQHDFKSFETGGSERKSTIRTVHQISIASPHNVEPHPPKSQIPNPKSQIAIEIEADGFLYNMVRNMVGTLVEIGRGQRPVEWAADVLAAKDRRAAGPTVPPHGLYLVSVAYEPHAGPTEAPCE